MSSGKAHALASTALAPVLASVVLARNYNVTTAFCVGVGCLLGLWLSPDLDIDGITYSETLLPGLIGVLFRAYWWPYAKLIPHRHWLSHAPVISTTLRIIYAFWWFAFLDVHWFVVLAPVWCGLMFSDAAHWLMDRKY